jgi:hypothetical protein
VTEQEPSTPKIDTTVPHSARIWNYWLGGKDNFAVDREAGEKYKAVNPAIVDTARASRAFIGRAVRYLVGEVGLRQLLDIGTGLPTVDNTHEIAQRLAPECHVVYVDNDPLVLAHARALLTSTPEGATDYIDADARDPEAIVRAASKLLDFTLPVGLMFMGVLAHVADYDQARAIVRHIVAAVPSGSYLAVYDGANTNPASLKAQQQYQRTGALPYVLRTPEQIAGYFEGLELVEPGVVTLTHWRPDASAASLPDPPAFGGVARKP